MTDSGGLQKEDIFTL